MRSRVDLKNEILSTLDALPPDALDEVAAFFEHLEARRASGGTRTPFVPVTLAGLWKGNALGDDDISALRDEMWSQRHGSF